MRYKAGSYGTGFGIGPGVLDTVTGLVASFPYPSEAKRAADTMNGVKDDDVLEKFAGAPLARRLLWQLKEGA